MLDILIPRVQGFLFRPVETFQAYRTDETRTVLVYFSVLLLFDAALVAFIEMLLVLLEYLFISGTAPAGAGPGTSAGMVFFVPAAVFFVIVIGVTLFLFIFSLWTHLWVSLLGGRKGFVQTLHAILYSMTPGLLLGWFPLVGMFASLWTLILFFYGIREFQEFDDGKAVEVILLSVFLPMVILAMLLILAIMSMTSQGSLFSASGSYR
jgi:hypothetical protein